MNARAARAIVLAFLAASAAGGAGAVNYDWTKACGGDPTGDPAKAKSFQEAFDTSVYGGKPGSYLCNVKTYCETQTAPLTPAGAFKRPGGQWQVAEAKDLLLSRHDAGMYPEIKDLSDLTYLDPSGSLGNGIFTSMSDAASCQPGQAYRAAMNSAFNCAIWGAKHGIHQEVLGLVKGEQKDQKFVEFLNKIDAKVVAKLQPFGSGAAAAAKAAAEGSGALCDATMCAVDSATGATLSRRLNNEATLQQCQYRYYLLYVDAFLQKKGPALVAKKLSVFDATDTGSLSNNAVNRAIYGTGGGLDPALFTSVLSGLRAAVQKEDRRTSRAYLAAVATYQEFARTYGPHVMLQLIERDYSRIRDGLDVMLTPVTQALYKATNAMGKKGTE